MLDSDGYPMRLEPNQHLGALMDWNDNVFDYPSARYVARWLGEGRVTMRFNGPNNTITSQDANSITFDYAAGTQLELIITATNPANHVRGISVRPLAVPVTQTWSSTFVEHVSKFSCLRFMDWQRTNNSETTNWGERTLSTSKSQIGFAGASYEAMADLCRTAKAAGWFCIPHRATDDYVRSMATFLKAYMPSDQKIYVEWSNEVWNDQFSQARFAREQGARLGLGNGDSHLARLLYQARRTWQVMDIFKDVFGTDTRLVRVLAGQSVATWGAEQMLRFENTALKVDAYSIAPYFGSEMGTSDAVRARNLTAAQIAAELVTEVDTRARVVITEANRVARQFNLKLLGYEGGQHLAPANVGDAQLANVFIEANQHPLMGEAYKRYFAIWKSVVGETFCHYNLIEAHGRYGSWGLMRHPADTQAPKWLAMMDAIRLG
jgi:hypothetical protein